jgi:drug/metabolite transporter (DMT)-like permease
MKQSISKFEICAIIGSFTGIIMISLGKPEEDGADSGRIAQLTGAFYEWLGINGVYVLGIVLAVTGAFMFACVGLLTRELKGMHYSIIMFNYALLLIVSSSVF